MISEPKLENRSNQPYVAIRSEVTMPEVSTVLPPLIGEVLGWVGTHGVVPVGAPFFRYLDGEFDGKFRVDVGVPVATAVKGDGRITADTFPAGRYAVVLYTGDYGSVNKAHMALLDWGAQNHVAWQQSRAENGHEVWGARIESYITDPQAEPDPAKWETEVAFLLADR